jgi:hypothetical protein
MPKTPKSWPRPHFTPGGGDALLYYHVFGEFDLKKPMDAAKYRTSGQPAWLQIVHCDRAKQADVIASFQSGPLWDLLKRDTPVTAAEAEKTPQCVTLRAELPDQPTLDYFRDVIGILTWLLDAGGVSVSDPQMLWLWSADEWREEAFEPNEPNPDRHTVILASPETDGTTWYHTRGMRKYGRPDLSVHGVGEAHADGVADLLDRFVIHQALGAVIAENEEVRVKGLPAGGVCRHAGNYDDPDFNNIHIEVTWPKGTLD